MSTLDVMGDPKPPSTTAKVLHVVEDGQKPCSARGNAKHETWSCAAHQGWQQNTSPGRMSKICDIVNLKAAADGSVVPMPRTQDQGTERCYLAHVYNAGGGPRGPCQSSPPCSGSRKRLSGAATEQLLCWKLPWRWKLRGPGTWGSIQPARAYMSDYRSIHSDWYPQTARQEVTSCLGRSAWLI